MGAIGANLGGVHGVDPLGKFDIANPDGMKRAASHAIPSQARASSIKQTQSLPVEPLAAPPPRPR